MNRQHPYYREDLKHVLATVGMEQLKGKSFLVTGATGLIGTCLIDALMMYNEQGAGVSIYAVGRDGERMAARMGDYLHSDLFHAVACDVRQPLPEGLSVDYVIPLASNTHPQAYARHPVETMYVNLKGAEHALALADACGATVLYPSSVEVYGNARDGGDVFDEDYTGLLNLSTARSCYTESKRACEALCQSYLAERGTKVKIARLSRVFGPTMLPTDTKASSQFIQKALAGEDIVLKSKGEQCFSYTYVADAVSAMLCVLLHGAFGVPYNIASEHCQVRLKDFAALCAQWAGSEVVFSLPSDVEQRGFSIAQCALLNNSRLRSLGWKSGYGINDAVYRTLDILCEK